jgi:uncharacterized SAM-binding protein YcdF (DUF218 family)
MKSLVCRLYTYAFGWITMIGALIVASILLSTLFVISQFGGNAAFPIECAVVFGSAVHKTEQPGPGIRRRTETAVHLLEKGSVERLIFTGGLGEGNRLSEARVMRNEALRLGVDPTVMRIEEGATSTWQNVKFVVPFVKDCNSVVGISDRYHLARIRFTAWRQGLRMAVYPAEQTANPFFEIRAIVREALGNLVYMINPEYVDG